MSKTTLDQWRVFQTIIEEDGFGAAAKKLNRSQSTISYSMNKLQSQLNIELIRLEGKRCELTSLGRNLLQRASTILNEFEQLEQIAHYLSTGITSHISLSVDIIFPRDILFHAIEKFSLEFPHTQIHLEEHFRVLPTDRHDYDITIGVSNNGLIPGPKLLEVSLIPVANQEHPIFKTNKVFTSPKQLHEYKQIFYQSAVKPEDDEEITSKNIWRVRSIDSAISAIKSNLCYGWLPKHHIESLLENNTIREICFIPEQHYDIPLYLIENEKNKENLAIQYLKDMILTSCLSRS